MVDTSHYGADLGDGDELFHGLYHLLQLSINCHNKI